MTYREHDTLDALLFLSAHTLAEQNANDLLSTDLSGIERPRSLDRRVGRLIRRERRAEQAGGFRRVAKNFLIALLVCCTVAFSLVMSIEGVRNAVFEAVLEWYKTTLRFYIRARPMALSWRIRFCKLVSRTKFRLNGEKGLNWIQPVYTRFVI